MKNLIPINFERVLCFLCVQCFIQSSSIYLFSTVQSFKLEMVSLIVSSLSLSETPAGQAIDFAWLQ
jgi:hypothetical protein